MFSAIFFNLGFYLTKIIDIPKKNIFLELKINKTIDFENPDNITEWNLCDDKINYNQREQRIIYINKDITHNNSKGALALNLSEYPWSENHSYFDTALLSSEPFKVNGIKLSIRLSDTMKNKLVNFQLVLVKYLRETNKILRIYSDVKKIKGSNWEDLFFGIGTDRIEQTGETKPPVPPKWDLVFDELYLCFYYEKGLIGEAYIDDIVFVYDY